MVGFSFGAPGCPKQTIRSRYEQNQCNHLSLEPLRRLLSPHVAEECLIPVLTYIPFLLASYGASTLVLTKLAGWKGLKLQKLAGSLSMYPASLVMIYYSHATVLDHNFWSADHHRRFLESAREVNVFANFYIATNIVQAISQLQTKKPPLLYQLMGHQVLSIFCHVAGFYFNRFRCWTSFVCCCEITNLFLVPVFACKVYFPEWKAKTWYLWNTRLLWITFVTHRLVLFPCWLAHGRGINGRPLGWTNRWRFIGSRACFTRRP